MNSLATACYRFVASTFILAALGATANAQSAKPKPKNSSARTKASAPVANTQPTNTMPVFKGKLSEFFGNNLNYPDSARARKQEGKAVVQFPVETTGLIGWVRLKVSSGYKDLDEEALRVARLMQVKPYWEPAVINGKPTAVLYTLPFEFKLD